MPKMLAANSCSFLHIPLNSTLLKNSGLGSNAFCATFFHFHLPSMMPSLPLFNCGDHTPAVRPPPMHRNTQTVRYRWKKLISAFCNVLIKYPPTNQVIEIILYIRQYENRCQGVTLSSASVIDPVNSSLWRDRCSWLSALRFHAAYSEMRRGAPDPASKKCSCPPAGD